MATTTLGEFNISLLAIDDKTSPFKAPMTAIADDGSNYGGQLALVDALRVATAAIVDTVPAVEAIGNRIDFAASKPTVTNASRSNKISFQVKDSVTAKIRTRTVAGPKTSLVLTTKNNLSLTAAPIAAWKAAYEAVALSDDGNTLTIVSARITGRSLE